MLRPVTSPGVTPRVSAYYWAPVADFLAADPAAVFGRLASANAFPLDPQQRDAWEEQVGILKTALHGPAEDVRVDVDPIHLSRSADESPTGDGDFRSAR